jgi:hypothetical protein
LAIHAPIFWLTTRTGQGASGVEAGCSVTRSAYAIAGFAPLRLPAQQRRPDRGARRPMRRPVPWGRA